jgi:chromate reductase
LFATPEYNSSIPGVLKNAVDWLSRPSLAESALRGKPAAVVGASIGVFGAVWAQAELRKVLGATGARVIEGEVALGRAMDRFDADGRLNDQSLEDEVREVVDELLAEAELNDPGKLAARASDVFRRDRGADQWTHGCECTRKKGLSSNETSTASPKGA